MITGDREGSWIGDISWLQGSSHQISDSVVIYLGAEACSTTEVYPLQANVMVTCWDIDRIDMPHLESHGYSLCGVDRELCRDRSCHGSRVLIDQDRSIQ